MSMLGAVWWIEKAARRNERSRDYRAQVISHHSGGSTHLCGGHMPEIVWILVIVLLAVVVIHACTWWWRRDYRGARGPASVNRSRKGIR